MWNNLNIIDYACLFLTIITSEKCWFYGFFFSSTSEVIFSFSVWNFWIKRIGKYSFFFHFFILIHKFYCNRYFINSVYKISMNIVVKKKRKKKTTILWNNNFEKKKGKNCESNYIEIAFFSFFSPFNNFIDWKCFLLFKRKKKWKKKSWKYQTR